MAGSIGILAYGSLIADPGNEIGPLIERRVATETPFPVEYGRYSGSRGGGPTVVPHAAGKAVRAEVLVLKDSVSLDDARALLWRREIRNEGSGQPYRYSPSPNAVVVQDRPNFCDLAHALYTDFNDAGKIPLPDPAALAQAAIKSVKEAPEGKDGISYLIALRDAGVITALTPSYVSEVLRATGGKTLPEALRLARLPAGRRKKQKPPKKPRGAIRHQVARLRVTRKKSTARKKITQARR